MFTDCIFQGIFFLLLDVLSDSLHYFWNFYTYPHNRIDQFIKKKTSDENSHQSSNK